MLRIILAGGRGERFWPLSRHHRPKQFLPLLPGGKTLLQATAERLVQLGGWSQLWVITGADLAPGVREQLPELPPTNLIIEPASRDTGPAVAWAILQASRLFDDQELVGFFPADHWIEEGPRFAETLERAARLARSQQALVTLGIPPTHPATGYGYIECGEPCGEGYWIRSFREKPNRELAEQFLAQGTYYWNAGIFLAPLGVFRSELSLHAPELFEPLQTRGPQAFSGVPKISIDYALMEKTSRALVVPASFRWDDLGDWRALERLGERGHLATARHVGLDTQGTLLYTTSGEDLIVTIGLEDLIIVRDGPITLIAKKERSQEIKKILEALRRDPELQKLL
jgi:mannose-1-phosphate guanylyltransferase